MAKANKQPKEALPSDDKDTPPADSQSADAQQELDALLAFDAETKPPIEFAKGTPTSEPGQKRLVFRDDPRALMAHRLDTAPKNSKVVVTDVGAVYASSGGGEVSIPAQVVKNDRGEESTLPAVVFDRGVTGRLPDGDTAHTLPIGSKILKLGEQSFRALVPSDEGYTEFTGDRVNMLIAEVTHFLHDAPTAG